MARPKCPHCGKFCFKAQPANVPIEILNAARLKAGEVQPYLWSTCVAGKAKDKETFGVHYDDLKAAAKEPKQ